MNASDSARNISLSEYLFNEYLSMDQRFNTACASINLILGLPINVYSLWLIVTGAGGTIPSEFFALNLTISEILFSLSAVFQFICLKSPTIVVMCILFSLHGFLMTGRPLFQCCICVERYLAVVHPVIYLKYKPLRYRVGCCGVVWLMVLGSCLCYTFLMTSNIYKLFFSEFLLLLLVKLFCCLSVLRALKRPGPGEEEKERQGSNDMKMRAFKIILIIMMSMIVNYLPFVVMTQLQGYLNAGQFVLAMQMCYFVILFTGYVHPLLYLHRAGKLSCFRGHKIVDTRA